MYILYNYFSEFADFANRFKINAKILLTTLSCRSFWFYCHYANLKFIYKKDLIGFY